VRGRVLPVVEQGVHEHGQRQRRVLAADECVNPAAFDLLNQSQFGQRRIQRILQHQRLVRPRRDIRADKDVHVAFQRAVGNACPVGLFGDVTQPSNEPFLGELRLRKVVEGSVPSGRAVRTTGQVPVEQPERTRFFQVGIEPLGGKQQCAQFGWPDVSAAVVGLIGGFFQDAGHQAPVADRADHVFADAQRDDGFVAGEDQRVGRAASTAFLGQP
jgi:hypothetical protein